MWFDEAFLAALQQRLGDVRSMFGFGSGRGDFERWFYEQVHCSGAVSNDNTSSWWAETAKSTWYKAAGTRPVLQRHACFVSASQWLQPRKPFFCSTAKQILTAGKVKAYSAWAGLQSCRLLE